MTNSEEYHELKSLILSKRKKMVGVSSDCHWLWLHREVRSVLSEAIERLKPEQIAHITGFPKETVERWTSEQKLVSELAHRVNLCRRSKALSVTAHIRPDVCALASKVSSIRALEEAVGVSRTTIKSWLAQGWDKVDTVESMFLPRKQLEKNMHEDESCDAISNDLESKQLEVFLERHKGKVRKKYSLAEKKLMLSIVERFGSKAVHDKFGVSYDTIARLKRRQDTELERKKRIPLRYIPVIDIMRKHPGMGPMQIRDYIRRHMGLSMGVNSIRKVMEQNGWVPPYVKTTRIKDGQQFYEAARKNYMWHMDFKHQWINKCKVFILFVQDDYSRFIVGHASADGEKIDVVLASVEEAIRVYGKPEAVMSDGGSAFMSWRGNSKFTRFLEDFGIEQLIASTPNVNGKLESLNQQVEKELILTTNFASVDHFQRELAKWVGFYNFSRVHQGLDKNQVPADRYFPGAKQWYGETTDHIKQQSLIAETMATLLSELKKPK